MGNAIELSFIVPDYLPAGIYDQLASDDGEGNVEARIETIIRNNQAEIELVLGKEFDDTAPWIVKDVLARLVRYALYLRRGEVPTSIENDYKFIKGIGAENQPGELQQIKELSSESPTSTSAAAAVAMNRTADDAELSLAKLKNFPVLGGVHRL